MIINAETVSFGVIALILIASGLASALVKRTFHSVMFLGVFLVAIAALYILLGSPLVGIIQILVYVGGILTLFVFAVMFVAGDETEGDASAATTPAMQPRSSVWAILGAVFIALVAAYIAFTFVGDANHAAAGLVGGHYETSADGKTQTWTAGNLAMAVGFGAGIFFIVVVAVVALVGWLGLRHAIDSWSGARIFGTAVAGLVLGLLVGLLVLDPLDIVPGPAPWEGVVGTEADQIQANALDAVLDALFGPQAVAFEVLGVLLTAVMIGALVLARPLSAPPDSDRYAHITRDQLRESQSASDVALHSDDRKVAP